MAEEKTNRSNWVGLAFIGVFAGVLSSEFDPNSFVDYALLFAGVAACALLVALISLVVQRVRNHGSG